VREPRRTVQAMFAQGGLVSASALLARAVPSPLDQHAGLSFMAADLVHAGGFDRFANRVEQSCAWAKQRADRAAVLRSKGGTRRARVEARTALSLDPMCPLALVTLAKSDETHVAAEAAQEAEAKRAAGGKAAAAAAGAPDGRALAQSRIWLAFAVMEAEEALTAAVAAAAALAAASNTCGEHGVAEWAVRASAALGAAGSHRPMTRVLWRHRSALASRLGVLAAPPSPAAGRWAAQQLSPQQAADVLTTQVGHRHARAAWADDLRPADRHAAPLPAVAVVPTACMAAAAERAAGVLRLWASEVRAVRDAVSAGSAPGAERRREAPAADPVVLDVQGWRGGEIVLLSRSGDDGPYAAVPPSIQAGMALAGASGRQPMWAPPPAPQTRGDGRWDVSRTGLPPGPTGAADVVAWASRGGTERRAGAAAGTAATVPGVSAAAPHLRMARDGPVGPAGAGPGPRPRAAAATAASAGGERRQADRHPGAAPDRPPHDVRGHVPAFSLGVHGHTRREKRPGMAAPDGPPAKRPGLEHA